MPPTKWDSKAKRTRRRLLKRQKLAYFHRYRTEMEKGRARDEILAELANETDVSEREVERILAQGGKYEADIKRHCADLSVTASILASNFEIYLDNQGAVFSFVGEIGDALYGGLVYAISYGQSIAMRNVDRSVALNLLYHLKEEFPELGSISDWAQLSSDKISHDFIARLRLQGNRGEFAGKCASCP